MGLPGLQEAAAGGPDDGFYGGTEAETVTGGAGAPAYGAFGQVEAARDGVHRETGREQSEQLEIVVADLAMRSAPDPSQRLSRPYIPSKHLTSWCLAQRCLPGSVIACQRVPGPVVTPERVPAACG
jgi:hypothetical protein